MAADDGSDLSIVRCPACLVKHGYLKAFHRPVGCDAQRAIVFSS